MCCPESPCAPTFWAPPESRLTPRVSCRPLLQVVSYSNWLLGEHQRTAYPGIKVEVDPRFSSMSRQATLSRVEPDRSHHLIAKLFLVEYFLYSSWSMGADEMLRKHVTDGPISQRSISLSSFALCSPPTWV